ncbi:hypothetical protein BEL04_02030 [Mucilaginibacter sp. PPCGB 2223]|uniref:hypothetical protein n=1 Tax=Mucilaginibacter sp. PPCGB 2223 TaxID=1886027 RepID=UPI00082402E5|nr:hypothetical protein [Mucilaginibacter sp. PPCGB 2223]OCX53116.1 hypothetical protein BEL04_02030 [Mucilaginibacter sp. PPCGB 2223]
MYRAFNLLRTSELTLVRRSFFFPWYELSDGQFAYGKLSYEGFFRRRAVIELADRTYRVDFASFFSRMMNIILNGEVIGSCKLGLFSKAELKMNDGFEAEFTRDSVWTRGFAWNTSRFGEIIKMTEALFSYKKVITITIDPNSVNVDNMPLLCFLGSHLIILRRNRRRSAQ